MKKILKFTEIAPKIKKEIKHLSYADRSMISSRSRNDLFEYYNSTLEINADFNLDFKEYNYEKEARGIMIDGDLIVNGDIINSDLESGKTLIVKGNVYANNLILGGGVIHIYSKANIKLFCTSTYNHGSAYIKYLTCKIFINNGHHTIIDRINTKLAFNK